MEDLNFDIRILSNWKNAIVDLHEIKSILHYRDIRSVVKWCKTNDLFVISTGNTQVVNLIEFLLAFYKPYLDHLKRTKENWKELFWDYVCANVSKIMIEKREQQETVNHNKPKSNVEKSFLKKMKDL